MIFDVVCHQSFLYRTPTRVRVIKKQLASRVVPLSRLMLENNKKHCHPELACRDVLSGRSEVKPETE